MIDEIVNPDKVVTTRETDTTKTPESMTIGEGDVTTSSRSAVEDEVSPGEGLIGSHLQPDFRGNLRPQRSKLSTDIFPSVKVLSFDFSPVYHLYKINTKTISP